MNCPDGEIKVWKVSKGNMGWGIEIFKIEEIQSNKCEERDNTLDKSSSGIFILFFIDIDEDTFKNGKSWIYAILEVIIISFILKLSKS